MPNIRCTATVAMLADTVAAGASSHAGSTSDTGSAASRPRGGHTAHGLGDCTHSSQTRSLTRRSRFRAVDYSRSLSITLSDLNDAGRAVGDRRPKNCKPMIRPSELLLTSRPGASYAARPPPSHHAETRLTPARAPGTSERPRKWVPKAKVVVPVPVKERRVADVRQLGDDP
jgi:hypothetical protein